MPDQPPIRPPDRPRQLHPTSDPAPRVDRYDVDRVMARTANVTLTLTVMSLVCLPALAVSAALAVNIFRWLT